MYIHLDHLAVPLLSLTNQITETTTNQITEPIRLLNHAIRLLNQSDYWTSQIIEPIRLTQTTMLNISMIINELSTFLPLPLV